jgi:thiamine biosynthesis lipoprotein
MADSALLRDSSMRISRRKAIVGMLGAGGALGLGSLSATAVGTGTSRSGWALGSDVSMTVHGLPRRQAEAALAAAFAELETVEQVMSLYRPASQLCQLNRVGELRDPHPYLLDVLRTAETTSRRTGGAFDITVQPLWQLCWAAKKEGRVPGDAELAAARSRVDWRRVEITPRLIRLHGAGTAITLNGLAQGFAADRAIEALRARGCQHALVNAGEIGTRSGKSDGQPWTVGIQHPRARDAYVALAGLAGRCLSTSGDYEAAFTPDFRKNHIFDPRTGQSPAELASVTIVAPTALQADALSTAAMVLGMEETLRLVSRLPGVDALLVTKEGRTAATAGFPELASA